MYPLFSGEEQNKILWGGSGFVRSRLVYNITPAGLDVKGGEAVYFTLDLQILAVLLRHTLRKKTRTAERESGSNPAADQSIFW